METSVLVTELVGALAPFLPYLMKAGEKIVEGALDKIGEDSWGKAKAIWKKLGPKIECNPTILAAARRVAEEPRSRTAEDELSLHLKSAIIEDPAFAADLDKWWHGVNKARASGDRSIAVARAANNNIFNTGDNNIFGIPPLKEDQDKS